MPAVATLNARQAAAPRPRRKDIEMPPPAIQPTTGFGGAGSLAPRCRSAMMRRRPARIIQGAQSSTCRQEQASELVQQVGRAPLLCVFRCSSHGGRLGGQGRRRGVGAGDVFFDRVSRFSDHREDSSHSKG